LDVLGEIGKTLFLFIFLGTKEEDKLHCKKGDFSVLIRNALYGVQKPYLMCHTLQAKYLL
jgi:hypothetical protein